MRKSYHSSVKFTRRQCSAPQTGSRPTSIHKFIALCCCSLTPSSCIAQIPLVASRHDTSRHNTLDVSCVSRRACFMAEDEKAVVLGCKILIFCALDLQWKLLEKLGGHVHPSQRCDDVLENVSCESRLLRLSWRACRAVLSDKRDAARHNFSLCQNTMGVVSWHDATSGIWASRSVTNLEFLPESRSCCSASSTVSASGWSSVSGRKE